MKYFILILFFLTSLTLCAQEDVIDVIAEKTCKHIDSEDFRSLSSNEKNVKLGVFILKLYSDYEKELKEQGHQFNMSDNVAARNFGQKIGVNMVKFCPEAIMLLAGDTIDDVDTEIENLPPPPAPKSNEDMSIAVTLNKVHNTALSYVEVEDDYGKTHTMLVVEQFTGKEFLTKEHLSTRLQISYKEDYFYDLSERGYRKKKVITYIEKL